MGFVKRVASQSVVKMSLSCEEMVESLRSVRNRRRETFVNGVCSYTPRGRRRDGHVRDEGACVRRWLMNATRSNTPARAATATVPHHTCGALK